MPGESLAVTLRWQGPAVPWVAGGHVPLWSDLVTSPHEEMSGVRDFKKQICLFPLLSALQSVECRRL